MSPDFLLKQFARIGDAPDAVERLRRFVLDLAVRGKLVPQDPSDELGLALLARIEAARDQLTSARAIRKAKPFRPIESDEVPFPLPSSWTWVRLGRAFNYDAGTKVSPKEIPGGAWLLELEDIDKNSGKVLERVTAESRDPKSTKSAFQVGDVLYGKLRPYLNKVVVADEAGFSTTEIVAVRCYGGSDPQYTSLALRRPDFVNYVTRLGQGTKMPRLRTEDAVSAPFPLPPLAEQHRIVAKVDELMALCDELEAAQAERESRRDRLVAATLHGLNNGDSGEGSTEAFQQTARFYFNHLPRLTTKPEHIRQLRQTILNLAVRGKLVPQNEEEKPPGTHVLPSAKRLEAVAEGEIPCGLPNSWQWQRLGSLAVLINGDRGKNYPNRGEYVPSGLPFINTGHIEPDGSLDLDAMHYLTRAKFDSLRGGKIKKGDLVYCLRGATLGKTAIISQFGEGAIASSLVIIRLAWGLIPQYVYYYLTSPLGREQIKRFDNGSAQPNLSANSVRRYITPVPPLAEQHRIVDKVDELMALCDELESRLADASDTRRALLEAALQEALPGRSL